MSDQRAWIVVNGVMENEQVLRQLVDEHDLIIAADGGTHHILAAGLAPHVIIGDLDSLPGELVEKMRQQGVEIYEHPSDKDETDFELAVNLALNRGWKTLRIAAALGGRLDQTLANLFHLLRPELEALDVRFDDGREEIFLIREVGCLTGSEGDIVSLIPLLGICEGVSTEGLRYPLSNETLYPERTRGISNRMLGESARVSLAQGVLMCIHTRKHLKFGHFPPLAEQLQNGIVN